MSKLVRTRPQMTDRLDLRLPPGLRKRIDRAAAASSLSASAWIRLTLTKALRSQSA